MGKPISIIMLTSGYTETLRGNIVSLLEQDYDSDYEVVVVRDSKKGETSDVVKQLMPEYGSKLSTTYLPDAPKYITDVEVSIMLGTKAARYENIILVTSRFDAPGRDWLQRASEIITQPLMLGLPLAMAGKSWLKKTAHKRKTGKLISTWLGEHGLTDKQVRLPKELCDCFEIAYLREDYIAADELRYFIFRYVTQ